MWICGEQGPLACMKIDWNMARRVKPVPRRAFGMTLWRTPNPILQNGPLIAIFIAFLYRDPVICPTSHKAPSVRTALVLSQQWHMSPSALAGNGDTQNVPRESPNQTPTLFRAISVQPHVRPNDQGSLIVDRDTKRPMPRLHIDVWFYSKTRPRCKGTSVLPFLNTVPTVSTNPVSSFCLSSNYT